MKVPFSFPQCMHESTELIDWIPFIFKALWNPRAFRRETFFTNDSQDIKMIP